MPTHHAPEHVPRSWRSCNRCSLVCILNPDSKVERQNLRYLSLTSRHLGFSYHRYKHITNLSSKKKKKKRSILPCGCIPFWLFQLFHLSRTEESPFLPSLALPGWLFQGPVLCFDCSFYYLPAEETY